MEYDKSCGDFRLDQQDRNLLRTEAERLPITSIGDLADKANILAQDARNRLLSIKDTAPDAEIAKIVANLQLKYAEDVFSVIAMADVEFDETDLDRLSGQS